ncbi:MAG: thioesterase II family protein [Sciscionella sp.]
MTGARLRLLCFPPAGGHAAPYRAWQRELLGDVEVVPVDLDEGHDNIASLLAAMRRTVVGLTDRPVALFGHSFGALMGYELARDLRDRNLPLVRLTVSGSPAPQHARALLLPVPTGAPDPARLDAWYRLADDYRYEPRPPLDRPISVLGGLHDPLVRPGELRAWQERTSAGFRLRMLPGSHELLRESGTYMLRALAADIANDLESGSA